MELLTRTVLALYLAHLLTDLVLQTAGMVKEKRSGAAAGYVKHGAVYFACGVAVTGFFVPGVFFSMRFQIAVLMLTLAHLGIDWCKIAREERRHGRRVRRRSRLTSGCTS